MKKYVNKPEAVQKHLDNLAVEKGDLESVCTHCGDCCHASINTGKSIVVVPELPCRFLVAKSDGKFWCSVYADRFQKAPWCRDLLSGALTGAYPTSCNYMRGMEGYNGGILLNKGDYASVRPALQEIIKGSQNGDLEKAFHQEDIQAFLEEDSWLAKGLSGFADVDPSDWLDNEFPQLQPKVKDSIQRRLYNLVPERTYFAGKQLELIKGYVDGQTGSNTDDLLNTVHIVCDVVGVGVSSLLHKAVQITNTARVGTQKAYAQFEQMVMRRWLLEKAVKPAVLEIVDEAQWYRDVNINPSTLEAVLLGKALELNEAKQSVRLRKSTKPIIRDMLVFRSAIPKSLIKAYTGGPYIGAKGGKWANQDRTIPWHPEKTHDFKINRSQPPLWHDPEHNQFVQTFQPAEHYIGAHDMPLNEFNYAWENAREKPSNSHESINDLHKHSTARAIRAGHPIHPEAAEAHDLQHSVYPINRDMERMPGDSKWYQHFGIDKNPGWDGNWSPSAQFDPPRVNPEGVEKAAISAANLTAARVNASLPDELIRTAAMFAANHGHRSDNLKAHFGKLDNWMQSSGDPEDLRSMLRHLGNHFEDVSDKDVVKPIERTLREGIRKFPKHGPSLRDWLASQPAWKTAKIDHGKTSHILQMLGYSGTGAIDSNVVAHLTGNKNSADKISDHLKKDGSLYAQFENALRNSSSYQQEDPEGIRTGLAQWRAWNAGGGDDQNIGRFAQGLHAALHGDRELVKAIDSEQTASTEPEIQFLEGKDPAKHTPKLADHIDGYHLIHGNKNTNIPINSPFSHSEDMSHEDAWDYHNTASVAHRSARNIWNGHMSYSPHSTNFANYHKAAENYHGKMATLADEKSTGSSAIDNLSATTDKLKKQAQTHYGRLPQSLEDQNKPDLLRAYTPAKTTKYAKKSGILHPDFGDNFRVGSYYKTPIGFYSAISPESDDWDENTHYHASKLHGELAHHWNLSGSPHASQLAIWHRRSANYHSDKYYGYSTALNLERTFRALKDLPRQIPQDVSSTHSKYHDGNSSLIPELPEHSEHGKKFFLGKTPSGYDVNFDSAMEHDPSWTKKDHEAAHSYHLKAVNLATHEDPVQASKLNNWHSSSAGYHSAKASGNKSNTNHYKNLVVAALSDPNFPKKISEKPSVDPYISAAYKHNPSPDPVDYHKIPLHQKHEDKYVLGKTASGKPIFFNSYATHGHWTPVDHIKAKNIHGDTAEEWQKISEQKNLTEQEKSAALQLSQWHHMQRVYHMLAGKGPEWAEPWETGLNNPLNGLADFKHAMDQMIRDGQAYPKSLPSGFYPAKGAPDSLDDKDIPTPSAYQDRSRLRGLLPQHLNHGVDYILGTTKSFKPVRFDSYKHSDNWDAAEHQDAKNKHDIVSAGWSSNTHLGKDAQTLAGWHSAHSMYHEYMRRVAQARAKLDEDPSFWQKSMDKSLESAQDYAAELKKLQKELPNEFPKEAIVASSSESVPGKYYGSYKDPEKSRFNDLNDFIPNHHQWGKKYFLGKTDYDKPISFVSPLDSDESWNDEDHHFAADMHNDLSKAWTSKNSWMRDLHAAASKYHSAAASGEDVAQYRKAFLYGLAQGNNNNEDPFASADAQILLGPHYKHVHDINPTDQIPNHEEFGKSYSLGKTFSSKVIPFNSYKNHALFKDDDHSDAVNAHLKVANHWDQLARLRTRLVAPEAAQAMSNFHSASAKVHQYAINHAFASSKQKHDAYAQAAALELPEEIAHTGIYKHHEIGNPNLDLLGGLIYSNIKNKDGSPAIHDFTPIFEANAAREASLQNWDNESRSSLQNEINDLVKITQGGHVSYSKNDLTDEQHKALIAITMFTAGYCDEVRNPSSNISGSSGGITFDSGDDDYSGYSKPPHPDEVLESWMDENPAPMHPEDFEYDYEDHYPDEADRMGDLKDSLDDAEEAYEEFKRKNIIPERKNFDSNEEFRQALDKHTKKLNKLEKKFRKLKSKYAEARDEWTNKKEERVNRAWDKWNDWEQEAADTKYDAEAARENWEDGLSDTGGSGDFEVPHSKENQLIAHEYGKALANAPYTHGKTIYRGMSLPQKLFDQLEPGKEFDVWPISSWSTSWRLSSGWKSGSSGKPVVVFVCENPIKGTYIGELSTHPGENEVITGGHVVVKRIDYPVRNYDPTLHYNQKVKVYVEQVPSGQELKGYQINIPGVLKGVDTQESSIRAIPVDAWVMDGLRQAFADSELHMTPEEREQLKKKFSRSSN